MNPVGSGIETDNAALEVKLELRRRFLREWKAPIRVLDCCEGAGVIWARLRDEFPVQSHWGVDMEPRKGAVRVESARLLEVPGLDVTVVDIDTYGLPWCHYLTLVQYQAPRDMLVFLTVGSVMMFGMTPLAQEELRCLGLDRLSSSLSKHLAGRLREFAIPYVVYRAERHGWRVEDAEIVRGGPRVQYLAVRLQSA